MTEPSPPQNKNHDDKKGHRKRLRQRILDKEASSLHDYEILEALLFSIIPRRDTKPIAKALLKKFKNFRRMINADPDELKEFKGMGDQAVVFLTLIRELMLRLKP